MVQQDPPSDRAAIILDRRTVIKGLAGGAAGGLLIGAGTTHVWAGGLAPVPVTAFLRIAPRAITVIVPQTELGQGVHTTLPMLLAEELDCDWRTIVVEMAPLDAVYGNPAMGQMVTGGSTSMRGFFLPLRRAGAAARLMLIGAAAAAWRVPADECVTEAGAVLHPPSGRAASYGALAPAAARHPVPAEIPLRPRTAWRLLGRPLPRLDLPAKVDGAAVFGIDVRIPGMRYAAIRHCPVLGGTLVQVDETAVVGPDGNKNGRVAVLPLRDAVVVVADHYWQARTALDRIGITWGEGANAGTDDQTVWTKLATALDGAGQPALRKGDVAAVLGQGPRVLEAEYRLPFLAHGALEPTNCTVHATRTGGCDIWTPTQAQSHHLQVLPKLLGIDPAQVRVHTTYAGGSFGRRFEVDAAVEAALISRAVGAPIQLIWSREEDFRRDFYRPASLHRITVAFDPGGDILAWRHRLAAPSVMARMAPEALRNGIDPTAVEGLFDQAYAIPAHAVDCTLQDVGVPVGFWRSAGHGANAFVVESMLDEVASAVGADPYRLRRRLLAESPRFLTVLDRVAERAGWDRPLPARSGQRRGRGIALHASFGSIVGVVAEVTVDPTGRVGVDRLVAAADCGLVVHSEIVRSQIQGAMLYGLGPAISQKITIAAGRVVESNFDSYPMPTLADCPAVEIDLIDSEGAVGGAGEPGTPPVAPAIANAVFSATGQRVRALPLSMAALRSAG